MQSEDYPQLEPAGALHYFKKAVEVVKLNRQAMAEVAKDENAMRFGLAVTAIGGGLAALPHTNIEGVSVAALYSLAVLFLFAGFVHILAGRLKGKDEFMGFVRVMALSGIIDWVAAIPQAAIFVTIWSVMIAIVAAKEVYALTGNKSTLCVLLSTSAVWLISQALFSGLLGSLFEMPGPQ